jgi:hypothetical protein
MARKKGDYGIGMARKGKPHHADSPHEGHGYKKSSKMHSQSAGAKRAGDNTYADYPNSPVANDMESTGSGGGGSMSGAAPMGQMTQGM